MNGEENCTSSAYIATAWGDWVGKSEHRQERASAKCFIDGKLPDPSVGLSTVRTTLGTVLGHLWGSGRADSAPEKVTGSSNPKADLWKDPLFSPSAGDGAEVLGLQWPVEMGLELGPRWKYLGDHITPFPSQDWKKTNANNATRTSWR